VNNNYNKRPLKTRVDADALAKEFPGSGSMSVDYADEVA
jgi:hypothetical protein